MPEQNDIYELAPEEPPKPADRPHTRKAYAAVAAEPVSCPKCGYDLRGTPMQLCPECGTRITRSQLERHRAKKRFWREVYLEPTIYLVGGLAVTLAISFATSGGLGVIGALMGFGLAIVVGWVVFVALSAVWIGFDQPLVTTAVQLAGAYAGAFAVSSLMSLIPLPLIGWIIPLFVLVGLLAHLLDIEMVEAWVVALLSWLAIVVLLVLLFAAAM